VSLSHDETRKRLAEAQAQAASSAQALEVAEACITALEAQAVAGAQALKEANVKIEALTLAVAAIEAKP
jgi:hypothetical protein